jgi:hypothetical protein
MLEEPLPRGHHKFPTCSGPRVDFSAELCGFYLRWGSLIPRTISFYTVSPQQQDYFTVTVHNTPPLHLTVRLVPPLRPLQLRLQSGQCFTILLRVAPAWCHITTIHAWVEYRGCTRSVVPQNESQHSCINLVLTTRSMQIVNILRLLTYNRAPNMN